MPAGALPGDDGLVILDVERRPSLEAEGMAHDVVRLVQQARRDAGLQVTDRIRLRAGRVLPPVAVALYAHRAWVAEQTLAVDLDIQTGDGPPQPESWQESQLPDGRPIWLRIRRA